MFGAVVPTVTRYSMVLACLDPSEKLKKSLGRKVDNHGVVLLSNSVNDKVELLRQFMLSQSINFSN